MAISYLYPYTYQYIISIIVKIAVLSRSIFNNGLPARAGLNCPNGPISVLPVQSRQQGIK
jgi:hypothetical protein